MEMLDLGLAGLTRDPMRLPSDTLTWPPYSTPMHLSAPVTFYDEAHPETSLLTIEQNTMSLYDYHGMTIRPLSSKVDAAGVLHAAYQVTNQTGARFSGRWMLIGDHADRTFANTDKPLELGPAGSRTATATIEVTAPVTKSELTQRVAFAVMSLSDPVVLGITARSFKYPYA
ncbi:hypothetical protein [Kitasatospora sp. NPDC002040]|uniref:hypothetical protein n=1 Tax=Kitasatospora sp. NPDC002040 TaxID=3154661 RepID=UPI00332F6F68